jgi:hypothetical protein
MKNVIIGSIFVLALAGTSLGQQRHRSGCRHYFNSNYNFCIEYPKKWQRNEALDGNAIALLPPGQRAGPLPYSAIFVGGHVNQTSEQDENRGETLDEIFESGLKAFQEGDAAFKATQLKVTERRRSRLVGYPVLVSTIEYVLDNRYWQEHQILILTRSDAVFELTLTCRADQIQKFTPIFNGIVHSFRIRCNSRLPERP